MPRDGLGSRRQFQTAKGNVRAVQLQSRTEAFHGMNLLQDRRPEHYDPVTDQSYRRVNRP